MKRRTAIGVALAATAGVRWASAQTPEPRRYDVLKSGKLVLTMSDRPGPIVSTAGLPPGVPPVQHPFLTATAHAPEEEGALHTLLEQSTSFDDFVRRLQAGGYVVRPR